MLRAGPLSDERVIALANRRFVVFYFDLSDRGVAGDSDARRFVVRARPELGKSVVSTPPLLFITPDGTVVGEVSNYASADTVLRAMLRVLREHPDYDRPSHAEARETDPLRRAQILFELHHWDQAAALLRDVHEDRARYLLGHMARWRQAWEAMERHFAAIEDPALADDVRMERAYRLWHERRFAELRDWLKDFPADSNRYSEARYYYGLALHHLGRRDAATDVWATLVRSRPQGPWVYRADWAYTTVRQGRRFSLSTRGPRVSLLKRIGYMGPPNPDLQGP